MPYSREENLTLAKCMAPAIVEALGSLSVPYFSTDAESGVIAAVAGVDFEAAGLQPTLGYNDEGSEMMYSPRTRAEAFIRQAVEDSEELIYICGSYTSRHPLPEGVNFQDVLINSQGPLLQIADMKDRDIASLFGAFKNPYDTFWLEKKGISQESAKAPVSLRQQGEHVWFDWHPDIKAWITEHSVMLCPARKMSIEDPQGEKSRLINYLWSKLVLAKG